MKSEIKKIIAFKPLANVLMALALDEEKMSNQELRASLMARGYDPDALIRMAKQIVKNGMAKYKKQKAGK